MSKGREWTRLELYDVEEPKVATRTDVPNDEGAQGPKTAARNDATIYERGACIGRYVILERLGKGGMGVVYRAFDPELGRPVALKLLSSERAGGRTHEQRLVREAQALARLSHPNVVSVFDVGTLEGEVFIATEFVEGVTLERWLADAPRSVSEILQIFLAAGEGLAAAHRAGLVHRDFKPDNVMVGDDRRVRVLDFGLVRATASTEPDEIVPELVPTVSSDQLVTQLTRAGAIMGTPTFMAPEQHLGEKVDERADQYSFGVALYGALYGAPPFAGSTLGELRRNVLSGRLQEPPRGARVPRWIRKILVRAIAVAPEDRYPSMSALLDALRSDPSVARWRAVRYLTAASAAVAAAILWRAEKTERVQACHGAEQRLFGVWDDGIRARVRAGFAASAAPFAEDTFLRVNDLLDGYATAWIRTRTETCEATRLRGEQSTQIMDLRTQCLDDRLGQLSALTAIFAQAPNRSIVERAVEAASRLGGLEACSAAAVAAVIPPASDPASRARVNALRAGLNESEALERAGQSRAGLARIAPIAAEAQSIGYAPVEAEAVLLKAILQKQVSDNDAAQKSLEDALQASARARDDVRVARSMVELFDLVGRGIGKPFDAMALAAVTDTMVVRAGDPPAVRVKYWMNLSKMLTLVGRADEALVPAERAAALAEHALGADSLETAYALRAESGTYGSLERYDDEEHTLERAIAIFEARLGPEHPEVARALMDLGFSYNDSGNHDAARGPLARALAIGEKSFDRGSGELGEIYLRWANQLDSDGEVADSERYYRAALSAFETAQGPESRRVGMVLFNMSDLLIEIGRIDEARANCERSLFIFQEKKTLGDDHPLVALSMECIGNTLRIEHRYAEAIPHLNRALSLLQRKKADTTPYAYVALQLATTYLEMGRSGAALPLLESAVHIYEQKAADRTDKGRARFALARILWQNGSDRRRALDLAAKAREDLVSVGARHAHEVVALDAWQKGKTQDLAAR